MSNAFVFFWLVIGIDRLRRLHDNTNYFRERLKELGFQVFGFKDSPVTPVLLYNPAKIAAFSREAFKRGVRFYHDVPLLLSVYSVRGVRSVLLTFCAEQLAVVVPASPPPRSSSHACASASAPHTPANARLGVGARFQLAMSWASSTTAPPTTGSAGSRRLFASCARRMVPTCFLRQDTLIAVAVACSLRPLFYYDVLCFAVWVVVVVSLLLSIRNMCLCIALCCCVL